MNLKQLLENIYDGNIDQSYQDWNISSLSCDSRAIEKNSLFVALSGAQFDGKEFIAQAVDKGACVVVADDPLLNRQSTEKVCYLYDSQPFVFLRKLAQKYFGKSSDKIRVIGVTGTNGKTTIVYLMESILKSAGLNSGIIGTINYRIGNKTTPSLNTTPGFLQNQNLLAEMVREHTDYCIMEVSSHALDQGRVDLIDFKTAIFTNLTSDHMDYHKTRENYFNAKSKLFTELSSGANAVINVDDGHGRKLISMTDANIITYGIDNQADVMAKDIQAHISGTQFKLVCPEGQANIRTNLVGRYNISNILAAAAAGLAEGLSLDQIKKGIEQLRMVSGRLEKIEYGQDFTILIDYAHTQDALENVLETIRETSDAKIILVFGCGGDRDKTKRSKMGHVADQLADRIIITNDNPRTEDPQSIIDDIVAGIHGDHHEVIINREEAIQKAMDIARPGDVVLITGKGHERYQIFNDKTINFDERQIIREYLRC